MSTSSEWSIHPSIGIARLGNSESESGSQAEDIVLAPEAIGGLPFAADKNGNKKGGKVTRFKDKAGRIKRQGQAFKIFDGEDEITLETAGVESIQWTVHLANKKAAWYQYSELQGNLLYGPDNSYAARGVGFRNANAVKRQKLIIDPGPRTISGKKLKVFFDQDSVGNYPHASFPPAEVAHGTAVKTLGELRTDEQGRLVVLGGFGHAGGDVPLTSYGGSDTWHDDISDGPVYCAITRTDGEVVRLKAWVIVGSPDFAPEIVNISNLSDTMFDIGVRYFDLVPSMCEKQGGSSEGTFKDDYQADYQRDILPIINRIRRYQWVANVPSMSAFAADIAGFSAPGDTAAMQKRKTFFSYFREMEAKASSDDPAADPQQKLFKGAHADASETPNTYDFPMMPLNSGSNSVSNITIEKFLALNRTQYFLLKQWSEGKFTNDEKAQAGFDVRDTASVGNCVGLPMAPGIEVTWSIQDPKIYERAYTILHQHNEPGEYNASGLSPSRDECEGGGCEPGDLTKRMACPWHADFFQCTIQYVNFTDPAVNKSSHDGKNRPELPVYYAYWWPPQSPWDVLAGETSVADQEASLPVGDDPDVYLAALPAGIQVNYARGINSFVQMVEYWFALGFIRDQNPDVAGYPYFVETERIHSLFACKEVKISEISGCDEDKDTTIPVFFINRTDAPEPLTVGAEAPRPLVEYLERRAFKAIEVAAGGLGMPRSGTRARR